MEKALITSHENELHKLRQIAFAYTYIICIYCVTLKPRIFERERISKADINEICVLTEFCPTRKISSLSFTAGSFM